ncbi:zinc ion-binding protein [Perilla frutescens var. hirtella]|uniref:Zinc ion-binding protein n=1 Tax=Perilla frutescens var. hirtella TaxID=608512 RepID=A0AAD4P3Q0_PERFH|nr:zinc ion-binding protein [Perilla frutescens var. hirtella]KAH6817782.1 zinc ion-binding protein [Perilla frutescens var. frutescens]KAH6825773.1 zinc ion-binding protein [Perilla frutescens var. hirtella]
MVDLQTVCCMCGDVGFPDKLFRCSKCRNRFQHSYCSNYYRECAEPIEICDWCQCEERNPSSSSRHGNSSSSSSRINTKHANEVRSAYSGDKIKQHHRDEAEKTTGKTPSPRPSPRRYKLLKDVMC